MSGLSEVDIQRMRDQLFFEGPERNRRLSRYWLLLPLAAVIASAGVVSDSTATVIGAMIVAPLMTDLPRAFRTADLRLIHAAICCSRYSSWTCCGVRY